MKISADSTDPGPLSVAEGFRAAWNRGSAEELAAVFAPDADFVNVVGFWWRGHRQIRHNHAIGFRDIFPDTRMTFEKTRVRLLSPEHAVVHARWRLRGQRALGDQVPRAGGIRRGILSFVVSEVEGRWLAVSAQNTDIIPGAQTHLAGESGELGAVSYPARD